MQAVRQAEADTSGKDFPERKAAVAAAAMRIFRSRGIKELTEDKTDFGNSSDRVTIRDGVFIVTSFTHWWHLTPVLEGDEVKEVTVGKTFICSW